MFGLLSHSLPRKTLFDTTARSGEYDFNGCWACYPYLGDDRILASDIETGLWVLELLVPTIKGTFTLNDFAGSYSGLTPTLEFRRPGTTEVVATYQATLDANGQYTIKDVKRGTYDVAVKFSTWLRQVMRNVHFDYGQETTVHFSLTNGDVNGDNTINDQDLSQLLIAFGQAGNRPEDLDRNGAVEDRDLPIVLINFGRQGDT